MKFSLAFAAALVLLSPAASRADVHPSALFGDNMVLQRGVPIPVYGTADPAEKVKVTLGTQAVSTAAGADGHWKVSLPALPAGGPFILTMTGKNTVTVNNVLLGDVWLCSGQSNMQYAMQWHKEYYAAEIAASADPKLRSFTVANKTSPVPIADLLPAGGSQQIWQAATPDTVPSFTAVGYFFARELRKQLHVPIGIIHSSWGGTNGESWASREALSADPELKTLADTQISTMQSYDTDKAQFPAQIVAWEDKYGMKDPGNTGEAPRWAKPDFSDADWKTAPVPVNFGGLGMKSGGAVWFRKTLDVPADAAGKAFTWNLGWSADSVTGYANGVPLPVSPSTPLPPFFTGPHSFTVPAELVKAGKNVFALRVYSHNTQGIVSPGTARMNFPVTDYGPDADTWHYAVEHENAPLSDEAQSSLPKSPTANPQNTASYIYNAQIAPLMPFAIKGVIWYQGENNSGRGRQYRKILPTLIGDWRTRWGEGRFPFYIVQLANYGQVRTEPGNSGWADVREAQLLTAQHVPNTGLAVAVDVGEGEDIHPRNKQDVGKRLAFAALAKTYGQKMEYSGPLFSHMIVTGSAAKLSFTHSAGLTAKGGPLKTFAVAGDDRKFVWADAKIVGAAVLVSSPQVAHPVAVRYAWADNPEGANLYNAAGLPASPFRTDVDTDDAAPKPPAAPAPAGVLKKSGVLLNGDFSSPAVPAGKDALAAQPDGWTFDVKSGSPALGVQAWKKERPPFFFWSDPNGSLSQTADVKTSPIKKAGTVYTLSYFYGGQGRGGAYTLAASILVDGKVAVTDTKNVDLSKPGIDNAGTLSYIVKKADVGKSVGVSFTFTKQGTVAIQGALRDVDLSVK